jgi:hypothetical protein
MEAFRSTPGRCASGKTTVTVVFSSLIEVDFLDENPLG